MLLFSGAAKADAIEDAARHYHLNADLLRAIGYYESHLNAAAFHRNKNGSVDIGLMQINSIHLASLRRQGIDANMLKDAHVNADVGASLLRRHIDEYGPTWQAVGEYHSHNAVLRVQYARAIHDIYMARPWAGMKHEPALAPRDDEELVVQDIAAD
ncbi:lytic transglycosylase domain-containing protein [Burkholderia sp. ABCPW 14]|uniref:lytic transglycosylase domain-containing protein n=1 Tax=Burkholderia sp. ABCPW 14 TaxID=1637860 RepID=UPI0009E9267E|nr:lytic transglycosylase domain-containing protein [Burkholderia sp. ABCPW 14]